MLAASLPIQRPSNAKLLVVDACGNLEHLPRSEFANLLQPSDVVIANDAATLPASLSGRHSASGRHIEVRLAGRTSLALNDVAEFSAVVFGAGDFRIRTEDRPKAAHPASRRPARNWAPCEPPSPRLLNHPRLISLRFDGTPQKIWEGLVRHGRPIQYSHVPTPLALWDTWTPIAGPPGRLRAAVSRLRARLEHARIHARPRNPLRHNHPRRRHLIHRRRGTGRPTPLRRALSHSRDPPRSSSNPRKPAARASSPSVHRSSARWSMPPPGTAPYLPAKALRHKRSARPANCAS